MLQRNQLIAVYLFMSAITGSELVREQSFKNWACFLGMVVMIFVVIAFYWGRKA